MVSRRNAPTLALVAIAFALAILIGHDIFFPNTGNTLASLRTALASIGTVTNSVSSTGSLVPAQQSNLGFKTAGTLTEVDVKVGDTVSAGQVLAKIDPSPLQLVLQSAEASLAAAQAQLANTQSGTTLQQATDQLTQAQQAYTNAVNNQTADQNTLNSDTLTLNADRTAYNYAQYVQAFQADQAAVAAAQTSWASNNCIANPSSGPCTTAQTSIQTAQADMACLQGTTLVGCSFSDQQMSAAYKAAAGAQNQVSADSAKVNADATQVQQATNSVTNAQDSYNSQAVNRPATLAQQAAQVAAAQAQVNTAQQNLDGAVLTAPYGGVVTALSSQAGDAVAAGGSSTGSQAPGTTALLPSSGTGSSASGGGGGGFISISSAASYLTVVAFAESDAAKVQGGQIGSVTFDAISGLRIPVHVLAVAASATVSSNVVNYYVTLALDGTDPALRAGMTTNASVITSQADNAITVLNSAIVRRAGQTFVNLLQNGKQALTQVTLGVVGTTTTQVLTGLKAGDTVVLPTATVSGGATGLGGRLTTGGGGGGRGFGGGGAGLGG